MMLPIVVAVPESKPTLLAIVNPVDGRSWSAEGVLVACPLSPDRLKSLREKLGQEPFSERTDLLNRILVFKGQGSSLTATAPTMPYNGGFVVSLQDASDVSKGIDLRLVKILPGSKSLSLRGTYSYGPWETFVEFTAKNGALAAVKGADHRPRLLNIPAGYELTTERKVVRKSSGSGGHASSAVVFDVKALDLKGFTVSGTAVDVTGRSFGSWGGGGIQDRDWVDTFEIEANQLARYTFRRKRSDRFDFANVAMAPRR